MQAKAPYLTESALFFDSISYSRVVQTSDHRFTIEVPIRKDFVPGHTWKRCYPDGTWTIITEVCHKFRPRNIYVEDFVAKANQATVFASPNDFKRFNLQMEGTEPVTLSEITGPEFERVQPPDYPVLRVPKRSRSVGYAGRQWKDIDAPPPIPSWQRDHIRVPVPQAQLPSRAMETHPYRYQVQSQSGAFREAKASNMPDLTARPTSLNEHLAQQDYIKQREQRLSGGPSSVVPTFFGPTTPYPPPICSAPMTQVVTASSGYTPMHTRESRRSVHERLGPLTPPTRDTDNNQQEEAVEDPPINHSRPYNMNYQLTEEVVKGLTDGQIKRQYTALKRKYQRALSERRPNLARLINQQTGWYVAEMQRRRSGRYRLRADPVESTSTSGQRASQANTAACETLAAGQASSSKMPITTTAHTAMETIPVVVVDDDDEVMAPVVTTAAPQDSEIVSTRVDFSLSPIPTLPSLLGPFPTRPKRRKLNSTPPQLPKKQETSAEKLYRQFVAEPETDTRDSQYWNGDKEYMWGGLSDWSELDSTETQTRYKRRHVKNRAKHPIITRREYRDKKILAIERGYLGPISNSPYKRATFCLNGKPEPPKWWKKNKRDKILADFEAANLATGAK